ncbi:hypothetical protein H9L12_05285 [Sphingomonas rhizophila]|uniref:Envelope stress response membrane protein PspB n=1 Tax=Sphingomonas rhizophila TaxID=2071607 RepID=A0A7G9SDK9_9SPHN|nr:hypothetical protein [Sphingomonas rhizophila]QNN65934.1 hypothetical protein H9L12_05285 [Sphingomonas rhizophila]
MGPSPGEVIAILFSISVPAFLVYYLAKRWFQLKERRLEVEALVATSKSAGPSAVTRDFEQRLAVLERIVTDQNNSLSREIDALALDRPRNVEAVR